MMLLLLLHVNDVLCDQYLLWFRVVSHSPPSFSWFYTGYTFCGFGQKLGLATMYLVASHCSPFLLAKLGLHLVSIS